MYTSSEDKTGNTKYFQSISDANKYQSICYKNGTPYVCVNSLSIPNYTSVYVNKDGEYILAYLDPVYTDAMKFYREMILFAESNSNRQIRIDDVVHVMATNELMTSIEFSKDTVDDKYDKALYIYKFPRGKVYMAILKDSLNTVTFLNAKS